MDAAANLISKRRAEQLSQAAIAKQLGVTANTVARWERREIPVPHWVSRLQALEETHAAKLLQVEKQLTKLEKANNDVLHDLRLKDVKISALKLEIKVLKSSARSARSLHVGPNRLHEFYRRLVREFHPDRNPTHPNVMRDINEIYQSFKE